MVKRFFRRISESVLKADQPTIDQWFISLDQEIAYAKKQAHVKAKVLEAFYSGVQAKKISEITGVPEGTIYGWVEQDKKAKGSYIKEAKELKESMEKPQNDQNPKEL